MSSFSRKIKNIIKNYWHYLLIILMLCVNIYDWANTTELFTQPEDTKLPESSLTPELAKTQYNQIKHHIAELKDIMLSRLSSGSLPNEIINNDPRYKQLKYILDEGLKPPESSETLPETTKLNNLTSMIITIIHLLRYTEDYILTYSTLTDGTPPSQN
tara:strand:- start:6136 stop:6609 length:474 start_codon:yes stop_codon:yes gene_type:complete